MSIRSSVLAGFHCVRAKGLGFALIGLVMVCAVGTAGAGMTPQYTLTDLGVLPGDNSSVATALNDQGQVVGISSSPGGNHAFIYSGGSITALVSASPLATYPGGVNKAGQVVGTVSYSNSLGRAVFYSNSGFQDLGTVPGTNSQASAINSIGQVVGSEDVAGHSHAFLYSGGTVNDLGTFGGVNSSATAINSGGQVIGNYLPGGSTYKAFVYQNGSFKDLGSLGGSASQTTASAINDSGDIVGESQLANASYHAFLYHGDSMIDIGAMGTTSIAEGINASGEVVGEYEGLSARGFLYVQGSTYDLNDLVAAPGYVIDDGRAIDATGQIVGSATLTSGETHAVLLTPTAVPLPPAAWASLTALPILLLRKWLRRAIA